MSEYDFPSPFAFVLVSALGLCAYAIWKYDLFALTPITVAENIVAAMTDTLLLVNTQHRIESCNAAALKMLELSEKELNDIPADKIFDRGRETPSWLKQEDSESEAEQIKYVDTIFLSKRGKRIPVSLASSVLYDNSGRKMGYLMIARDITERNRKEQELTVFKNHLEQLISLRTKELESSLERLKNESKEKKKVEQEREFLEEARASLEEQLYHAQKMESIGCLAGGVAHDFNNLLFVISSYSEAFINETDINDPLYADFKEIHQAATRATALTQQLLAFSRKQIISPVPVDPNEAISQLYKMLVRLIGEHIHFNIIPGINVGQIKIDPVQLDQLLMNLAVNSRDAMPHGGTITVEVNQEVLTPSKSTEMEGVRPGYYVRIRFSDTGIGMDEQTKARIFDPFFTTKAQGKGTGLGLATIYGIVKQNRGFIEVDSRLGEGTAFSLYFPRYEPDIKDSPLPGDFIAPEGDETILLVEDEEQVRRLAARLLRRLGYNVIEAAGAGEATRIFHEHKSNIDLLFTDVVMPDMDGKSLSKLLGVTKPRLKVLFMSGYNEEITDNLGHLNKNISFIAKPFSSDDLSRKIREVLDG